MIVLQRVLDAVGMRDRIDVEIEEAEVHHLAVLAKGAFDGFPTGSCVSAGLQEAAIFCTDVLNVNTDFRDGVDLVLVEPSVNDIVRRLLPVIQERGALARIGRNGRI